MPLFSVEVEGYRAFRDKAKIDIHPLTLLYGENQAGKSTLLRLLVLLADSLYSGRGLLNLHSSVIPKNVVFRDLGWLGAGNESSKPSFSLSGHNGASLTLKFGDEGGVLVDRITCKKEHNLFDAWLAGQVHRTNEHFQGLYEGEYGDQEWSGTLKFENLIPKGLPDGINQIVASIQDDFSRLEYIQWLGINRIIDGNGDGRGAARCCLSDGSDLISLIKGDLEKPILESVSTWLRQQGLGESIVIQESINNPPIFAIKSRRGVKELPASLAGEGVRSLLPILLCMAWAEMKQERTPSFLAIEEPESHLHPTLQVKFFDRLVETIKCGIPVVLETHSVYLLRAMQLAILEGKLSTDDVGLYWVGQKDENSASASFVEKITIENDARLSGWPLGTFETEQELSYEIMDLRWKKGTDS
ncbi:AAA family ATPase [Thiothrix subterranea]|uniref:AAA family ATPase n=1 Tax=Thiothrix subterranea TaxID=2735563 RepID=UPI00192C4790|nr:AAA family ATPase [Thiothrix subterranea]QQZ30661.1 AAA family ATPase [Thiothrix subterranea]